MKLKNAPPAPKNNVDKDAMNRLLAAQNKAEEELKVLKEDNAMLKRQNDSLSEQYREQARRFDQDEGIDHLSDDYVDSFKKQIENLTALLEKKDQ